MRILIGLNNIKASSLWHCPIMYFRLVIVSTVKNFATVFDRETDHLGRLNVEFCLKPSLACRGQHNVYSGCLKSSCVCLFSPSIILSPCEICVKLIQGVCAIGCWVVGFTKTASFGCVMKKRLCMGGKADDSD